MKRGKKEKNPERIGIGKFWAWGSREVSETANMLLLGYMMFYCTNTLGLNGGVVGILLAVSKVIDGITDIVVGYIVDKTHTPLGKGRPYELCIFGTWLCTFLMYSCPGNFGDTMKYAWVLSMYILVNALFNTFLNAGENVYMVRAFRSEQIVRISSFVGFISCFVGFAVNIIMPQLVERYAATHGGWQRIVLVIGIPVLIIGIMRFIFIKEEYDLDIVVKTESICLRDAFHMLGKNRYVWILLAVTFFGQLGSQLGLGTYYFLEVLGSIGLQSITSAVTIIALPLVFVFPKCIKKWKVRNVMIAGSVFSVLGGIVCFFSNKNVAFYMAGWLLVSFGALPGTYLTRLMMFDCASYNEWKKMPRMEGTIGAVQGFAKRVGAALAAALGGMILMFIGYDAQAVTPGAVMGIRIANTICPAVTAGIGILFLLFYNLDDQMPQINADNEKARQKMQESAVQKSMKNATRNKMRQYEMFELKMQGQALEEDWVNAEVDAVFTLNGNETRVKGFYGGGDSFYVRFLPLAAGKCTYRVTMKISGKESVIEGEENVEGSKSWFHGMVKAERTHFIYSDGTTYIPFGTTVYALLYQEEALIEQTMQTLKDSPFNKLRLCMFPKHYEFNQNEPELFPFEKEKGKWNVKKPCMEFWDRLDMRLGELNEMGIEADLILFHPYDKWGFSRLTPEECRIYLEYVIRRLAAHPNVWWSLANEYDQMLAFCQRDWKGFAQYLAAHDPYRHLLSNHNFVHPWDFSNKNTTHCCLQDSKAEKIPAMLKKYGKPVLYDEIGYEGNIPYNWGNLSAFEEVNRFWKIYCMGGYASHGETYMEKLDQNQVLWWSKGGTLKGESPKRIAFMREIFESLPKPLTLYQPPERNLFETQEELQRLVRENAEGIADNVVFSCMADMTPDEFTHMMEFFTAPIIHYRDEVFLTYLGDACTICNQMSLPSGQVYRIEVIDVWKMTRKVVMDGVQGTIEVPLPGKPGMAVLARKVI